MTWKGRKYADWIVLMALLVAVELFKLFPSAVEQFYSRGIYPYWSKFQRILFGWIPFSVGDLILYSGSVLGLILLIRQFRRKGVRTFKIVVKALLWIYLVFQLSWGLNYSRLGMSSQLNLSVEKYSREELDSLVLALHHRLWAVSKDSTHIFQFHGIDRRHLKESIHQQYKAVESKFPWLSVQPMSLKQNLPGKWQGYSGYAGYINPFTGEAQVNFHGPAFTLPFTIAHEMAHQAGFGNEREANLAAWLVLKESEEPAHQYSTYYSLFHYAVRELALSDSARANLFYRNVPEIVKESRREIWLFQQQYENPFQPILDQTYAIYLRSNNQPEGLGSYDRVNAWLIAYAHRFGWSKL